MFKLYQSNQAKSIKEKLERDSKGHVRQSYRNYMTVFIEDPNLQDLLKRDIRTSVIHYNHKPVWKDDLVNYVFNEKTELSHLLMYLELNYSLKVKDKADNLVQIIADHNKFHPIKDYLNNVEWDGEKRLGNLFIDYLGAEDNEFNKLVTKQAFVAGVARIYEPGYKHDEVIVLTGRQGIGKSYLLKKMGKGWFNDSLDTFQTDEAYMKIANSWIIELAELSALTGTGVERIKQFISATQDTYRPKYGRHAEQNLRECIFFGTTNDDEFLFDDTGNRRFIPMKVGLDTQTLTVNDLTDELVDQIWAEAKEYYLDGFVTYLDSKELKEELTERHKEHQLQDELEMEIVRFTLMKIPENWETMPLRDKQSYFTEYDKRIAKNNNLVYRQKICAREIREVILNDTNINSTATSKKVNNHLRKIFGVHVFSKVNYEKYYHQQRGLKITKEMLEKVKVKYGM